MLLYMPETKLSELGGFSRFLKTESNAQRLNRVIHIFREKHPDENLAAILEDLIDGKILERVLKDSNFWFPFNIEVSILEKLSQYLNIQEIFFEIGKEFFMKDVFEILPSDNIQINLYELISRLPLFIDRYIRYFEVDLIEIGRAHV